jgi:hypothetical protein
MSRTAVEAASNKRASARRAHAAPPAPHQQVRRRLVVDKHAPLERVVLVAEAAQRQQRLCARVV